MPCPARIAERSRAALAAGCDVVLHCNGDLREMTAVAGVVPELSGEAAQRADAALAGAYGAGGIRRRGRAQMFTQMVADERTPQRKIGVMSSEEFDTTHRAPTAAPPSRR